MPLDKLPDSKKILLTRNIPKNWIRSIADERSEMGSIAASGVATGRTSFKQSPNKKMKNTLVRVGGFPVSFKSPPFHCHADQLDDGRSRSIRQTDPAEVKSKETRILLPPLG